MKRDIMIGGAWPYANYYLHVGHLAALLPGDVLARYYRLNGDNVFYVSGSDCHGTPITNRAIKEGKKPEEVAKFYHEEYVKTFNNLGFTYDLYSNTMESFHEEYVTNFLDSLLKNDFLYEKEVEQDFCPKCNKYLSDRELKGICSHCGGVALGDQCEECGDYLNSDELEEKSCALCGTKTTTKINKHLYFKLTKVEKELQDLINNRKSTWRKNALGETQKYIDMGLVDRAVTRELDWGIPVKIEGFEDKKVYVWFEAVLGYLSNTYKLCQERNIDFDKMLSDDNENLRTYFVHGKDNIPFHGTIYPSLLLGEGKNKRLPNYMISCAYVILNDSKMSKSKGNMITANELIEKYDKDTIRFYFIFNGPETKDTNCSLEDLETLHNKVLVGNLGNFVNRNLSFINKKFDGVIKEGDIDEEIIIATKNTYKEVGNLIEAGEFRTALNRILEYISMGNKYYDENAPWVLVKEDSNKFNDVTYTCIYMINNIKNLIAPIMPDAADKIKNMLDLDEIKWEEQKITGDKKINNIELLFERID